MSVDEKTLALFDNYISGNLDSNELDQFKQLLMDDSTLEIELRNYEQSIAVLKEEGFRQDLKLAASKFESTERSLVSTMMPYMAAAVVLVATFSYLFWPSEVRPSELFTTYYQPYPNIYQTRGIETTALTAALNLYSSGNYEGTLESLNNIEHQSDAVYFYRAVCFLSLNRPDEAIGSMKKLSDTTLFSEQIQWYTGLAFLLQHNIDSSSYYLKRIQPEHFGYQSAQEIISEFE